MSDEYLHDVYGPASCWDPLPEGTTVGTCAQFVGFAVAFGKQQLLTADEADALAALLQEAAKKSRLRREETP